MAQTEHYGIRQWEDWEVPGHTDLNGALGTIDAALAALESGKLAGVFGSYTGNDASSRTISLGFTPRAVILVNAEGRMCTGSTGYDICGGVFFPGGKHTNCGWRPVASGCRTSAIPGCPPTARTAICRRIFIWRYGKAGPRMNTIRGPVRIIGSI